jgi:hypothetical protein
VSNADGDFELAATEPADSLFLLVEARGMAPKFFDRVLMGGNRQTLTVVDGATVSGRLVQAGKPVGGAQLGLIARNRALSPNPAIMGHPFTEIRIGTNPDGVFTITNVPAGVEWYLYGKMESLQSRGATPLIECRTANDGDEIEMGDIPIDRGFSVRGQVVLSDGKPIPDGMTATIGFGKAFDSLTVPVATDGSFMFRGLRADRYAILPSVKGYRPTANPNGPVPIAIERDVDGFKLLMDPVVR